MVYQTVWVCEKDIFIICNLKYENIFKFVAVEKYNNGLCFELWLVIEYYEYGFFGDYFKSYVVTWLELCLMVGSMVNGFVYLYIEVLESFFKFCIVYRDFKSKNVLVIKDLICCLFDFGLVMKFDFGGDLGEIYGQVSQVLVSCIVCR